MVSTVVSTISDGNVNRERFASYTLLKIPLTWYLLRGTCVGDNLTVAYADFLFLFYVRTVSRSVFQLHIYESVNILLTFT